MCNKLSAKEINIKLQIPAGEAIVDIPIGPALGQYGVNATQFCKEFNEETLDLKFFFDNESEEEDFGGFTVVADIYIKEDRSYRFTLGKPTTSFLLKYMSDVSSGCSSEVAGSITVTELFYIAQFKFPNLPYKLSCSMVLGTARSIGVKIIL